jgi:predicted TIM-barrel fold metal-dependent hydrolase
MFNGKRVFDIHGHVSSPNAVFTYVTTMMASNTDRPNPLAAMPAAGNDFDKFVRQREQDGLGDADFMKGHTAHVKLLDDRQIDFQVVGPRPYLMMGWMQPHLLPPWTRFVNDCIHKQVRNFPDRFAGAAQLPQNSNAPDSSHCIPELERCVKELGFVAAYASPDPGGQRTTPGMHEPYWYPLYEKCQELDVPIIVHGTNCLDRRFAGVPHNYQLGFATEQYLAGQFLQHSDVFKRFPRLRVVICHCGGALDRFIKTDPHLSQEDLSNNLFYDTCAYDLNFLEAAIKQRTPERLLFGSEVPGSGRAVRPETGRPGDDLVPIIGGFPFLSETDRDKIFSANLLKVVPRLAKKLAA